MQHGYHLWHPPLLACIVAIRNRLLASVWSLLAVSKPHKQEVPLSALEMFGRQFQQEEDNLRKISLSELWPVHVGFLISYHWPSAAPKTPNKRKKDWEDEDTKVEEAHTS